MKKAFLYIVTFLLSLMIFNNQSSARIILDNNDILIMGRTQTIYNRIINTALPSIKLKTKEDQGSYSLMDILNDNKVILSNLKFIECTHKMLEKINESGYLKVNNRDEDDYPNILFKFELNSLGPNIYSPYAKIMINVPKNNIDFSYACGK